MPLMGAACRSGSMMCSRKHPIWPIIRPSTIFADGNKRTALLIAPSLPALHGVERCFSDAASARDNDPYSWIQQIVSREKTEAQLAEQLRSWARLKTQ